MNFQELRMSYPRFIYHGFTIDENDTSFSISFDFEIEKLSQFNPTFTLAKPNAKQVGNTKLIKEVAFSIGLVELVSYWKLTCSPTVIIEAGYLNENQIAWWKKLYYHGLGEFFYTNDIKVSFDAFMNIECSGTKITGDDFDQTYIGNLIPVGGGKDSFVTMDILADLKDVNNTYVINDVASAIHASEAAGYADKLINPKRTLDARMLDLNKQGFLNGHTPFSALVAFTSYLTALIYGKRYICLSNESSANESTVKGEDVNHQYSKSYEFEQDFKNYCDMYLSSDVLYFSILRPLSELQITCLFSKLTKYHSVFRSCNVGSKKEEWCGHCAKCLFVYIMLSAFLTDYDLKNIFNKDLLNDETLLDTFNELCGISENKPFECVGTRDEVNTAIVMSIKKRIEKGTSIPLLYQKYMTSELYDQYQFKQNNYVTYFDNENMLPASYESILKLKAGECFK